MRRSWRVANMHPESRKTRFRRLLGNFDVSHEFPSYRSAHSRMSQIMNRRPPLSGSLGPKHSKDRFEQPVVIKVNDENKSQKKKESKEANLEGTIDHISDILNAYKHPFILVGFTATGWMGCEASLHNWFDLVIRTHQIDDIANELIQTGIWTLHKRSETGDTVLKRVNLKNASYEIEYLDLWTEETYHINVDKCTLIEVQDLRTWTPFLIEVKQHPVRWRTSEWWYGPEILFQAKPPIQIFNPSLQRGKGPKNTTPIFIPRIAAYLNALSYHRTKYSTSNPRLAANADVQIDRLIESLWLEVPHQRDFMLKQVTGETVGYLQRRLERYERRALVMARDGEGRMCLVEEWDVERQMQKLGRKWKR